MLVALMDGRAWTARELAHAAGVAAPTATGHLNRLVGAGLLHEHRQGRHRYVQLAGPEVAQALESVAALGNQPARPVRSLREASITSALSKGRTCYDHLAGTLGVAITEALIERSVLTESLAMTTHGSSWLNGTLGPLPTFGRRPATRACLDWTERRVHLAGGLGAHIAAVFRERRWVRPAKNSRAVVLTPAGTDALQQLFGVDADAATTTR